MKIVFKVLVVLCSMLILPDVAFAGWFGMSSGNQNTVKQSTEKNEQETQGQYPVMAQEISVLDNIDKHILKRQEEAHKLITEGKKLIKQGEQRKKQDLIIKGQIKKEIGEKQLQLLKEQAKDKKKEEANDHW